MTVDNAAQITLQSDMVNLIMFLLSCLKVVKFSRKDYVIFRGLRVLKHKRQGGEANGNGKG